MNKFNLEILFWWSIIFCFETILEKKKKIKNRFLFLIRVLILLLLQGGSLSLIVITSFGTKLLLILRMLLVKVETLLSMFFWKDLNPVRSFNSLRNWTNVCMNLMLNVSFVWWRVSYFQTKFCIYFLMRTVRVTGLMYSRVHN